MIVLFIFILFIALGMPIGFVLGVAGLVGLLDMGGSTFLHLMPAKIFNGLNLFPFLAMPFFILAGEIMNHTGITNRLVALAYVLVGHMRGGLAQTNMVVSVLFAGMTGSATSDAAAFGKTLVPEMVKRGYKRDYACAVTAAGSIIGPTIPPSGLMVIYGSIMNVSVGALFAAGILPGLMICLICMVVIRLGANRNNLPKAEKRSQLSEIYKEFKNAIPAIIMPMIILGGILGGIVTPTEAASVAVGYALFLGVYIYNNISFKDMYGMLIRTARITGVIFVIIGFATILGWWLSFNQIPQMIASYMGAVSSNPTIVVLMIIAFLLIVGMVMDITATLIIIAPVLLPLTNSIGMDPLHAGIMIILALNISLMTPPVGACLFVLSSVTGEKLERIAIKLMPFLIAETIIMVIFSLSEDLSLYLPRLFGFLD